MTIIEGGRTTTTTPTLTIRSILVDATVKSNDQILEVDATSGNIIITLPTVTSAFTQRILIKRIDVTANTVTINGTASNFEDDGIVIGQEPLLEVLEIYPSNSIDFWRTI